MTTGTRWRRATLTSDQVVRRLAEDIVVLPNGCWEWIAGTDGGYGHVRLNGKKRPAHRAMYEAMRGPLSPELTLDHLCHTQDATCIGTGDSCAHRRCVNPDHQEPVLSGENNLRGGSPWAINARKTHCIRGHELSGDNLLAGQGNRRRCKTCHRNMRRAQSAARRKGA